MNSYCTYPDCVKPVENRDLGLCASHAREKRKAEEQAKKVKVVKPVKKVSNKMAQALKEYSKLRKEFLECNPKCAVYPDKRSEEVHHMGGRATIERLLDTNLWLAVSREGHIFIETHPEIAYEKGWSVSRLAKTEQQTI